MFARLKERRRLKARAAELYGQVVARARSPEFYAEMGVTDDLDGRLDMVIVHAHLLFRRLKAVDGDLAGSAHRLSQYVFDYMMSDMDRSLREIGVGDLSVGKQMKKIAKAFYGRSEAVEAALDDPATLPQVLTETVYRRGVPDAVAPARLAVALQASVMALDTMPDADFLTPGTTLDFTARDAA